MLSAPWSLALLFAVRAPFVVLPFDVVSDEPQDAWKGVMLEEAVSAQLEAAGFPVIGLLQKNRLLDEIGIVPGESLAPETALLIARELGASALVRGALTLSEEENGRGHGHVEARLIDVESGATLGVVEDYGPRNELPEVASLVAKNVIRLERDGVPAGFEACATRRAKIPIEALEAGARARITLDPAEQRGHLEKAIAASEDYVEARVLLGELHMGEGRPRDAIDVLVAARGDDRIYRNAYFDLGVAYLEADMARAAAQVFQGLAGNEHDPAAAAATHNLGVAWMRLARFEEAVAAFEESCAADREVALALDEATCRFNLGWAYWRSGKGHKALEQFEAVVAKRPLDARARLLHGAAAMSQAMPEVSERSRDAALLLSNALLDVDPSTVTGWARPIARPRPGDTRQRTDEAVDFAGLEATADLLDARFLHEMGRTSEAIQLLQRTLYRSPDASFVRRELASLHAETGALESAISELAILLWADPSPDGHVALARLYLQMEDPSRAIEEVDRALEIDPNHEDATRLKEAIGSAP